MSLYNMLHGINAGAPYVLQLLGLTSMDDVPRFRDAYVDGEVRIVIYTRTGGGNRDFYENEARCRAEYPEYFDGDDDPAGPWNEDLRKLPGFIMDRDDDFDCTYASFYYSAPEGFAEVLDALRSDETPEQKFIATIERIQKAKPDDPEVKRLTEAFKPLIDGINDA